MKNNIILEFKTFDCLNEQIIKIRTDVFLNELKFKSDFDDYDKSATHIVVYLNKEPVGVCRYYWNENKQSYVIGKVAIIKQYRHLKIGYHLMEYAHKLIKQLNGGVVYLSAIKKVKSFYEKLGYIKTNDYFYKDNVLHLWMYKKLNN